MGSPVSPGQQYQRGIINAFIADNNLQASVALQGCLCEGNCRKGPNVRINGELFQGIQPDTLHDLLRHTLLGPRP
jgi:NADH:ubiquinone oxidoreductase subunit E